MTKKEEKYGTFVDVSGTKSEEEKAQMRVAMDSAQVLAKQQTETILGLIFEDLTKLIEGEKKKKILNSDEILEMLLKIFKQGINL